MTYPIDIENTKWAIYKRSTKEIVARHKKWPIADGGPIESLHPDYAWLLETAEEIPEYNKLTEKLVKIEKVNLRSKKLEITWEISSITEDELSQRLGQHFTSTSGIKLNISDNAQNAFTRLIAMIDLAGMANDDTVQIKDIFEEVHSLTVAELKTTLQEYAAYCYSLFLTE